MDTHEDFPVYPIEPGTEWAKCDRCGEQMWLAQRNQHRCDVTLRTDTHDAIYIVVASKGQPGDEISYAVRALSRQQAMSMVAEIDHWRSLVCHGDPHVYLERM